MKININDIQSLERPDTINPIHEINVLHRINKRFYCGRRRSVKTQLESLKSGKVN